MTEQTTTITPLHRQRRFIGTVTSDGMNKTIVVRVDRTKIHPLYQKRYGVSRKYKVHDEKNQYHVGDRVIFAECRPISKDKRWYVIGKTQVTV